MEQRLIRNRLRIIRQVGRGGMGCVYEVLHERLNVTYGLKRLVTDLEGNPEIERRFLEEAQRMARLRHDNIVRVFDIDQEPGFGVFFIMEFIRGKDLGEILRTTGRLAHDETLRIGIAVASALHCAHSAGIVHRDIKPANILIEEGSGRPVVTDFGIAKEIENAGDETFTRTGSFLGTYRYSSREQIRNEKDVKIDGRADVYSLGAVLYEAHSGARFLQHLSEVQIPAYVGYEEGWTPPLPYPEPPPRLFASVVADCLQPDRNRRIASASELIERLEACRDAGPEPELEEGSRGSAPPSAIGGQVTVEDLVAVTAQPSAASPATETRSQWLTLLQHLRGSVDAHAEDYERLLKALITLDVPRDEFKQLDDMSQILHRVERAEGTGQYQDAAANLQGLSDRIELLNGEIRRTLLTKVRQLETDLREGWHRLAERAGDLVEEGPGSDFEHRMGSIDALVEREEWSRCGELLRDATSALEQARSSAVREAELRMTRDLLEARAVLDELRRIAPDEAAPLERVPESIDREAGALIAEGQLEEALRLSRGALQGVQQSLSRIRLAAQTRAQAMRAAAEVALGALDLDEAQELSPGELSAASAAYREGVEALERGEHGSAGAAFERARAEYVRAGEVVVATSAKQLADAQRALRVALERAGDLPSELIGEGREEAARVATRLKALGRRDAIAEIRRCIAKLEEATAALPSYEAAREAEEGARRAEELARSRGARPSDLTDAVASLEDARRSFTQRRFADASEAFDAATAAFQRVAEAVRVRGDEERLAAARAEIARRTQALGDLRLHEACAAPAAALARARERLEIADRVGDRRAALSASEDAIAALADVEGAVTGALRRDADVIAARTAALFERGGDLVAAELRSTVDGRLSDLWRVLEVRDLPASVSALADLERLLTASDAALRETTKRIRNDGTIALRASWARLQRLGSTPELDAFDPRHVESRIDALLEKERSAEVKAVLDDARARIERAVERQLSRLTDAIASAERATRDVRRDLDVDTAREVAADELDASNRLLTSAEEARANDDLASAARLYADAADSFVALTRSVRERHEALVVQERSALAAVLRAVADAPDELLGLERGEAAQLVEAELPGDPRLASSALRDASVRLSAMAAEREHYDAACRARSAARDAGEAVAALRPARRKTRRAAGLMRDAEAAFAGRRWADAEQSYAEAARAYGLLQSAVEKKVQKETAVAGERPRAEPAAGKRAGLPLVWRVAAGAAALAVIALVVWQAQRPSTTAPRSDGDRAQVAPKPAPPQEVASRKARQAAPPAEVAKVQPEPSPPPAPPPLRITATSPRGDAVTVSENAKQVFSVDFSGGAEPAPDVIWRLDDEIVARDVKEWEYAPGFDAASDAPHRLEVVVGEGDDARQSGWKIDVANVNRKPVLTGSRPPGKIEAKQGETVKLRADAKDPDGDRLQYAWQVDGKGVASKGPEIEVPVTGDRSVSVSVSDGTDRAEARWQIAALKPVLKVQASPARLERLRFARPQEFALKTATAGVDAEWTVDGRKVASGLEFTFANDDPAKVRRTPVQVAVSARDPQGGAFERSWSFFIDPPAPEVSGAAPPAGEVEVEPGAAQSFELTARAPIGGQELSYVFQVDGAQAAKGKTASFRFTAPDDEPHRVVGFVQDNFDQVSSRTEWRVVPGVDILRRAQRWLEDYRAAFAARDAARIVALRGASSNLVPKMQEVLDGQRDLNVSFSNVRIEKLDDRTARLRYQRTDSFVDERTGSPVSRSVDVEQDVRVGEDGTLREVRTVGR